MPTTTLTSARSLAKAAGASTYRTGRPCKNGHLSDRLTRNGDCLECSSARVSEWKKQNREKLDTTATQKWAKENPDRIRDIKRRSYERNREEHLSRSSDWRRQNPERMRNYKEEYRGRHPERLRAQRAARRARYKFTLSKADRDWLNFIYEKCPIDWHVDHVIPLQGDLVSGLHVPWNLQHLPAKENRSKSNVVRL